MTNEELAATWKTRARQVRNGSSPPTERALIKADQLDACADELLRNTPSEKIRSVEEIRRDLARREKVAPDGYEDFVAWMHARRYDELSPTVGDAARYFSGTSLPGLIEWFGAYQRNEEAK